LLNLFKAVQFSENFKNMKALSVRQPWAWAIISALKDIENRGWPIHYRGDILIHGEHPNCAKIKKGKSSARVHRE
jgi:ASCH domain